MDLQNIQEQLNTEFAKSSVKYVTVLGTVTHLTAHNVQNKDLGAWSMKYIYYCDNCNKVYKVAGEGRKVKCTNMTHLFLKKQQRKMQ